MCVLFWVNRNAGKRHIRKCKPDALIHAYKDAVDTIGSHCPDTVCKELTQRSRIWLCWGEPAPICYQKPRERLEESEKHALDVLSLKGLRDIHVMNEVDGAPANIDFMINGQLWELKSPMGGAHAIEDRIRAARHKWDKLGLENPRLVLSNLENSRDDDWVLGESTRRAQHYGFLEMLFIGKSGSIKRIRLNK